MVAGLVHHSSDRLGRDCTVAATKGRDEDAGNIFLESEHETCAHAGIDDHWVFDARRDSHGRRVDELDGIDVLVDEIDMHRTPRNVFEDYNKMDGAKSVRT